MLAAWEMGESFSSFFLGMKILYYNRMLFVKFTAALFRYICEILSNQQCSHAAGPDAILGVPRACPAHRVGVANCSGRLLKLERGQDPKPNMPSKTCPECDRLWREHSEVSQRSFRLEARLRHAEATQDHNLAQVLAERLADMMREQNRTSEAFVEHQAKDHPQKGSAGSQNG